MDRFTITLAVSKSGTLYAGVPQVDGAYRIRRCRTSDRPSDDRDLHFEGAMAAVELADFRPVAAEYAVTCDGRVFRVLEGFAGPVVGKRMLAGKQDDYHEISSPIAWVGACPVDREWALDAAFRAHRNHSSRWRSLLEEQPHEEGFEGIRDDSSGLTQAMRERYYQRWLSNLSNARDRSALSQRDEDQRSAYVVPRHRLVSNEDLATALDAAVGEGFVEVSTTGERVSATVRIRRNRYESWRVPIQGEVLDLRGELAPGRPDSRELRASLAASLERARLQVAERFGQPAALPAAA